MNKTRADSRHWSRTLIATAALAATVWLMATETQPGSLDVPPQDSPDLAWWRESMRTRDERLGWWREARFGMFVHWGVYSGLGNEFQGRKGGGYAEHIQRVLKVPIPIYRDEVAGRFNPTNFNADDWIRTAKEAGMGYFVITAKHHDGFAMWPSKVNTYNLADATPFKRDPMKELRDACTKYGLKFGFYYSHAFDWGEANGPGNDWDYQNPGGDKLIGGRDWWTTTPGFLPKAREYVDEKAIPQLRELIENYHPDILWFDTPHKLPPSENLRILKAVRAASPNVVVNGRLVRGLGDYDSTADRPAEFSPHDGDWEGIPTTNESYGWNKFDNSHKPASHFIQILAKAVARGGNTLLNIGPMGDGRMDSKDVEILKGIGEWWKVNGASIRGCGRTPLPVQSWGESTRKGSTLYLHVFAWPTNGQLVVGGLKSSPRKAWLLSDAQRTGLRLDRGYPVYDVVNPLDVRIWVPTNAPDKVDSVVVLECGGDIATDRARLLQRDFASDTLRVFDAELHGRGLHFGPGKKTDAYVTGWTRPDEFIAWPVRLKVPATYDVEIIYDAESGAANGRFAVEFGNAKLEGTVRPGALRTSELGRVSLKAGGVLEPGNLEIKLTATEIRTGELMRPRRLILKPVAR